MKPKPKPERKCLVNLNDLHKGTWQWIENGVSRPYRAPISKRRYAQLRREWDAEILKDLPRRRSAP